MPFFPNFLGANPEDQDQSCGKELNELFSANRQTSTKKHHRKISSIAPLITETSKYRDEYDLSQEELIQNFISWKKNFDTDVKEMGKTRKPFTNVVTEGGRQENGKNNNQDSLYIEDE